MQKTSPKPRPETRLAKVGQRLSELMAHEMSGGIVLMLALAVVVHLTAWKNAPWWKESMAAGVATAALRGMKPAVPEPFGVYLPD